MKPKPSTRSFFAEWKASAGLSLFDLMHGYVYLRWPYFYIGNAVGRHPLSRVATAFYAAVAWLGQRRFRRRPAAPGASGTMADGYHGKVMPLAGARKLVTLKHDLTARNLEHVLPYPVAILEAEDRRGHVHHAFFKDGVLGRFYAISNCCRCCCGAMQAHRNGIPMLASSGYVAEVDATRCVACTDPMGSGRKTLTALLVNRLTDGASYRFTA